MPINIYRGILTGYNDAFYIDETTGELIVKAERSDDLVEENYKINENGELIIEF